MLKTGITLPFAGIFFSDKTPLVGILLIISLFAPQCKAVLFLLHAELQKHVPQKVR